MTSAQPLCSNFAHLGEHDDQLLRLGLLAERYFPEDPNTSLIKLRQLAELLGQMIAAKVGLYESAAETQFDLLRRLRDRGLVPREIAQIFDQIRRSGNAAAHGLEGDHKGRSPPSRSPGSSRSGFTAPSRTPPSSPGPSSLLSRPGTRPRI